MIESSNSEGDTGGVDDPHSTLFNTFTHRNRSGRPFSVSERKLAGQLYRNHNSLSAVARRLGRSPSGIYKLLLEQHVEIRSNTKLDQHLRHYVSDLYRRECLSARDIIRRLGEVMGVYVSKTAILCTLRRSVAPIPERLQSLVGSGRIILKGDRLDMLPFVAVKDLRWVDDREILLRFANSKRVAVDRQVDAKTFAYVIGLYAAEGNKGRGGPDFSNTNRLLAKQYHDLLGSFVRADSHEYLIEGEGKRLTKVLVRIGGECVKRLLANSINSIMEYLATAGDFKNPLITDIAMNFLKGYGHGDGSVTSSKQEKTDKPRSNLYFSEGNYDRASKLKTLMTNLFGKAYLYRPRGRNYCLVVLSLAPKDALTLLRHGFFEHSAVMAKRIASKALESKSIQRLMLLYDLFGEGSFSIAELGTNVPAIKPSFIQRALAQSFLKTAGTNIPMSSGPRWYRKYRLSGSGLTMIREIKRYCEGLLD